MYSPVERAVHRTGSVVWVRVFVGDESACLFLLVGFLIPSIHFPFLPLSISSISSYFPPILPLNHLPHFHSFPFPSTENTLPAFRNTTPLWLVPNRSSLQSRRTSSANQSRYVMCAYHLYAHFPRWQDGPDR